MMKKAPKRGSPKSKKPRAEGQKKTQASSTKHIPLVVVHLQPAIVKAVLKQCTIPQRIAERYTSHIQSAAAELTDERKSAIHQLWNARFGESRPSQVRVEVQLLSLIHI